MSGFRLLGARCAPGCGDRSRAAGKRAHAIASKLRSRAALGRDEANARVLTSTGELAELAETAARDAERLLANAKRALRRARVKADELRQRPPATPRPPQPRPKPFERG